MVKTYLSQTTYEEIEKKLKGKTIVTPAQLEKLEILSGSGAVSHFKRGNLKGEQCGKRSYVFPVSEVLLLVKKYYETHPIKKQQQTSDEEWITLRIRKSDFMKAMLKLGDDSDIEQTEQYNLFT